ncbi:hypothetical protein SBA7_1510005 [Candidatus Sulfotelmatobacter sp. SbA7]|nr:hypothetical protein SBA7_1510005 [Candidatus Sulfotelmatobacter sp. SbA7]
MDACQRMDGRGRGSVSEYTVGRELSLNLGDGNPTLSDARTGSCSLKGSGSSLGLAEVSRRNGTK